MADPTAAWAATSRAPATGTERIPVDTSDSSGPGQLTVDQVLDRAKLSYVGNVPTFTSPATGSSEAFRVATGTIHRLRYYANGSLCLDEQGLLGLSITTRGVYLRTFGSAAYLGAVTAHSSGITGVNQGIVLNVTDQSVNGRSACATIYGEPRDGADQAGYDVNIIAGASTGTGAGGQLNIWAQNTGTVSGVSQTAASLAISVLPTAQVRFYQPIAELTGSRYAEADESVTSSTTLVSHTDLQCPVLAGRTYPVSAAFTVTCGVVGGVKVALGGPAITSARWQVTITDTATGAVVADSFSDLSSNLTAVGGTEYLVRIDGMVRPSADGTVSVQFAQQTSDATATTVKSLGGARFAEAF